MDRVRNEEVHSYKSCNRKGAGEYSESESVEMILIRGENGLVPIGCKLGY